MKYCVSLVLFLVIGTAYGQIHQSNSKLGEVLKNAVQDFASNFGFTPECVAVFCKELQNHNACAE